MSEIMNCPFCNGRAIMRERFINGVANVKHYRLECADCHASFLNWNKNTSKAIAAWNRRADVADTNSGSEPLTLDELKQMDGEPVYVVTLDNQLENPPYWAIVGTPVNDSRYQGGVALYNKVQGDWGSVELYGKTWLAYRTKPKEDV